MEGLPSDAFIWVLREDLKNSNILYLGTEVGAFISFDAGVHWARFNLSNLPNVAVRDIFLQPEKNDILLATHGRGIYILDDATPDTADSHRASPPALFPVRSALRYSGSGHSGRRRRHGVYGRESSVWRDSQLLSAGANRRHSF